MSTTSFSQSRHIRTGGQSTSSPYSVTVNAGLLNIGGAKIPEEILCPGGDFNPYPSVYSHARIPTVPHPSSAVENRLKYVRKIIHMQVVKILDEPQLANRSLKLFWPPSE